ncbi:hypothetical protein SAMN05216389_12626 [Oceanobacillus limi]|uniref:Uncharacterized protein n=1 Tax=Oceanobacillus limi TaxID=930131 RepID=A0A1I0GZD7_9BACI|nr:hypothetical protein [Oceanobacillus limi]SET76802.1 hypothetical protein SAMN05216389_12626 [Oceanobacillus limi]
MKIKSLEAKGKETKIRIPVYTNLHRDENGDIKGKVIDHIEIPKEVVKKGE